MRKEAGIIDPGSIILVLILAGLSMLFLALSFAFIYVRVTRDVGSVEVPGLFVLNIAFLVAASYSLEKVKKEFFSRTASHLLKWMWLAFLFTLIFLAFQVLGWLRLFDQAFFINHSPGHSYLYALSALHMLHVLGGLPFLITAIQTQYRAGSIAKVKDEGQTVATFRRFKMVGSYWHFIDILWIYLVLFLIINSWIQ